MKRLRFAVIGAGTWGTTHARIFAEHPAVELAAVCDADEQRARVVAQSANAGRWTTQIGDIAGDDSIAAVGIATPDFAHTAPALAVLRAGKHLLVEKPLALTVAECEQIIAAARQAGVKLMVDFHNRWSPPFFKAKAALDAGEIGKPMYLYYRLSDTIWVPTQMLSWASKSTVAWFLSSHCLDTIHWLLGERPTRVYCVRRSRVLAARGIATPDYYQVTLEFPSGATALMENGWILPQTTPNIVDLKCEIVGDEGALYIDGSHHRMLERYTATEAAYPDTFVMPTVHGKPGGFAVESIRHFVECVVEDRPPLVTGEDGLAATRVIAAMEQSADAGQVVEIAWDR
ncbi:MAG TPA: Gfo/Idh/MocA family oxidoreductase [Armatimonadota bacterium]|nr:Gfo/Idh/MocA family oxidoreductase [Armatimonadota bacterium]